MYRYGGPTYLKAGVAYIHDKKRTPLVGEGREYWGNRRQGYMDGEIREQGGDFFIKHLIQKEKYDVRYITCDVGAKLHCKKSLAIFQCP